jgi:hypothetical protein
VDRRRFLKDICLSAASGIFLHETFAGESSVAKFEYTLTSDWLARWQDHILKDARSRYCDTEMGEQLAWLIAPYLNGFYYGYKATRNLTWVSMLVDWADSWIKRAVKEPDGFTGWPKAGSGGHVEQDFYADSLMGEATAFRPVVLMAGEILKTPVLKEKLGGKAQEWIDLAGRIFEKWIARGCWREVKDGGLWVVPKFGIDRETGQWTEGYARRNSEGFSHPANKQNYIALSLLALYNVTGKAEYRELAGKWWRLLKSRLRTHDNGKYVVWNYWDPSGPWDFLSNGEPQHWVGVHPSGGYCEMDAEAMVAAFEHDLVFAREDLRRLVATHRDFMWNQEITGAKFQRLDGRLTASGQKDWSGTLWPALVPYDPDLRKIFVLTHDPASWAGLALTPWFRWRLAEGFPSLS